MITRPAWSEQLRLATASLPVQLHASDDLAGDMRAVAAIAAAGTGPLVIANADILTQGEALAGLVADPRVATGVLVTQWRASRFAAFGLQSLRNSVLNAGTGYHHLTDATERFLGVVKVAAVHRGELRDAATELGTLLEPGLPEDWRRASELKARQWHDALQRARGRRGAAGPPWWTLPRSSAGSQPAARTRPRCCCARS